MSLLHRRMMMKGNLAMEEWRLLKTITLNDAPDKSNNIVISTDDEGEKFEVSEIYIRATGGERYGASYNGIKINGLRIGEVRGNFPSEVFIKNICGIWRCFSISYGANYAGSNLESWGTFHYDLCTLDKVPKIDKIVIEFVSQLEAEVYAK